MVSSVAIYRDILRHYAIPSAAQCSFCILPVSDKGRDIDQVLAILSKQKQQ
jgi:hypothetical protein